VVDECSRKDLWVEAAHSITATKLTETLDQIGQMGGWPRYIRCDNGPEFISHTLRQWAEDKKIEIKHIQPGKPTQNGIIERLNGTVRKECLNLFSGPGLCWWDEGQRAPKPRFHLENIPG